MVLHKDTRREPQSRSYHVFTHLLPFLSACQRLLYIVVGFCKLSLEEHRTKLQEWNVNFLYRKLRGQWKLELHLKFQSQFLFSPNFSYIYSQHYSRCRSHFKNVSVFVSKNIDCDFNNEFQQQWMQRIV